LQCGKGSRQFESLLNFDFLSKVIRKRVMLTEVVPSAGDGQAVDICLTLITSMSRSTSSSEVFSPGVVLYHRLNTLLGFGIEGEL
jgi:hypothetical protein